MKIYEYSVRTYIGVFGTFFIMIELQIRIEDLSMELFLLDKRDGFFDFFASYRKRHVSMLYVPKRRTLFYKTLDSKTEEYSETSVKRHSQKDQKLGFTTNYRLMQVKGIAECSKGSILQYFRPSLSYHLSLRPLFCLFLGGRFTQVLL